MSITDTIQPFETKSRPGALAELLQGDGLVRYTADVIQYPRTRKPWLVLDIDRAGVVTLAPGPGNDIDEATRTVYHDQLEPWPASGSPDLVAKLLREYEADRLRSAIDLMAERYAWSEADRVTAMLADDKERATKFRRRRDRRYAALRRLTAALATLAGEVQQ